MRTSLNNIVVAACAVGVGASAASADFVEPIGWSVGDVGATGQVWSVFSAQVGNTPDVLNSNPNGTALAGDANFPASGAFVTGGGNIYTPFGEVFPSATVPGFGTSGGDFTSVIVQLETLGSPIDVDTIELSDGASVFAPDDVVLTESIDLGSNPQFGGSADTWYFQFNLTGSADQYDFVVEPTASSLSFVGLRVDTFTSDSVTIEPLPPAVPEPASLGLLAVGSLALLRRR
jgi:hypothetical protein